MATLEEIKSAADGLSPEEKEQLMLALAQSLRAVRGQLPPPRLFSGETLDRWMDDHERSMRAFLGGR